MTPNNNLNILPWYDSVNRQHNRKSYVELIYPLVSARSKLPPFQILRYDNVGGPIQDVQLYRIETDTVTDITASILANGLEVKPVTGITNYDIIYYYPTAAFSYDTPEGRYYAIMSDGFNTWFSEIFTVYHYLNDLMKITYWHHENFVHSGAFIDYSNPFKNVLYLDAEVGKPEYPFKEKVREIDGRNLAIHQVSWKLYRFSFYAPEYLLDALRVIKMHSFVTIDLFGERYNVDEITISPEWSDYGDFAEVTVEFTTDTVIVTNGGALTETELEDFESICLDEDYFCKALISDTSPEYIGFYYAPLLGGGNIDFVDGDLVLISNNLGDVELFAYDASPQGYDLVSNSVDEIAYVQNKDKYMFVNSLNLFSDPVITEIDNSPIRAKGEGIPGTIISIYGRTPAGFETLIGTGLESNFGTPGINITPLAGMVEIQARCSSENCIEFAVSAWVGLTGIGWMIIEDSFIVA